MQTSAARPASIQEVLAAYRRTKASRVRSTRIGTGSRAILRDWTMGIGFGVNLAPALTDLLLGPAKTSLIPARKVVCSLADI